MPHGDPNYVLVRGLILFLLAYIYFIRQMYIIRIIESKQFCFSGCDIVVTLLTKWFVQGL